MAMISEQPFGTACDTHFAIWRFSTACSSCPVVEREVWQANPAVKTREQSGTRKSPEVSTHRLYGDLELFREEFDRYGAATANFINEQVLTQIWCHIERVSRITR